MHINYFNTLKKNKNEVNQGNELAILLISTTDVLRRTEKTFKDSFTPMKVAH